MAQSWITLLAVFSCILFLEVSPRPTEAESSPGPVYVQVNTDKSKEAFENENAPRLFPNNQQTETTYEEDNTKDILDKIKRINDALARPHRQQINKNPQNLKDQNYALDEETIKQLQQLIASGKYQITTAQNYQDSNDILNLNYARNINARALPYSVVAHNALLKQESSPQVAPAYGPSFASIVNMPVLIIPPMTEAPGTFYQFSDNINSIDQFPSTRQRPPSLPFPIHSPIAQYFPILIKDPIIGFLSGGGWNNFFEYGQSADVCNRKQKSTETHDVQPLDDDDLGNELDITLNDMNGISAREGRAIKKRTVSHSTPLQQIETKATKSAKKILKNKLIHKKPALQTFADQDSEDTKGSGPAEGDLKFTFGDFGLFGNRKPIAPSPGFFINRLKVRRGGVAIAGPGGVATAGRGGTAIVGPGGLAYTQPGGLAVAGPQAKVFAMSSDSDLSSVVSQLQQQTSDDTGDQEAEEESQTAEDETNANSVQYYPFYGGGKGQYLEVTIDNSGKVVKEKIVSEESISSENVVKSRDETLLSKVLAANLQNLQALSNGLLKLHNIGRKTGSLGRSEKVAYKEKLAALAETASNYIKLVEEIGDDVDMLFKTNDTMIRQYGDEHYDENVGEEGVGVDAPSEGDFGDILQGAGTIADAKPIGLAIIGEQGLAASRPVGTAVAISGVALARPIATAIAGIDPSILGINYNVGKN